MNRMPTEDSGGSRWEFGLDSLAESADRARRGRRVYTNAVRGVGGALVVVGLFFFAEPPHGSIPRYSSGPLLFLVIGVSLLAYGSWVLATRLGPSARRLVLTSKGASFGAIPDRSPVWVSWIERGLSLEIYDLRRRHERGTNVLPVGYDFIVEPKGGPKTTVPLEAVEAISLPFRAEVTPEVSSLSRR